MGRMIKRLFKVFVVQKLVRVGIKMFQKRK